MLLGRNRYVCAPPAGSVLSKALRAWKFAAKGRWTLNPAQLFRNFRDSSFWEQAKPSRVEASGQPKPKWMTFDDQWVDEVRRGLKACEVFVWYPIYCEFNLYRSQSSPQTSYRAYIQSM